MDFTQKSCREFVEVLASNAPVPGGGGAQTQSRATIWKSHVLRKRER